MLPEVRARRVGSAMLFHPGALVHNAASMMRRGTETAVVLFLCFAGACGGSTSSKTPSCESICASAMACPNFDLDSTFGVPGGATSCADACTNAHTIIDATHCNAAYDAVTRCASMHNPCTEDLQTVCGTEGGAFLACLQNALQPDGGSPDGGP